MAVKLSGRRRWLRVRNYIDQEYGVQVNFSDRHDNYYSAWRYTTKEDSSSLQSTNHPDLRNDGAPITTNASCALRERRLGEGDEDPLPNHMYFETDFKVFKMYFQYLNTIFLYFNPI